MNEKPAVNWLDPKYWLEPESFELKPGDWPFYFSFCKDQKLPPENMTGAKKEAYIKYLKDNP